jgi:hypothetical protein
VQSPLRRVLDIAEHPGTTSVTSFAALSAAATCTAAVAWTSVIFCVAIVFDNWKQCRLQFATLRWVLSGSATVTVWDVVNIGGPKRDTDVV